MGVYLVIAGLIAYIAPRSELTISPYAPWFLEGLIFFFLARYLSTHYSIDSDRVVAWRILGGRKMPLQSVRRIEFASLRELAPVGFFGSWGWHGRMWSARIGRFDAIYTEPSGLLLTGEPLPLFISPRDTEAFARELSRRVRSYTDQLAVDHGAPTS